MHVSRHTNKPKSKCVREETYGGVAEVFWSESVRVTVKSRSRNECQVSDAYFFLFSGKIYEKTIASNSRESKLTPTLFLTRYDTSIFFGGQFVCAARLVRARVKFIF